MRGKRWHVAIQLGAAVFVTVILLGMSELISAHYLVQWEKDRKPAIPGADEALQRGRRFAWDNPVPLVRDPVLLWRNMPGAQKTQPVYPRPFGRDDVWTVSINSEGFRGAERQVKDGDSGIYRILCVGDSVTYGFNTDQEAPFAQQLDEELRRRYPSRRFEVINAGVIGWTWVQGARFVERVGLKLHPNLIIIGHGANDQYWNARITDREQMWLLESPIARGAQAFVDFLTLSNTYRAVLDILPPPPPAPLSPACELQSWETGGCHRASLEEIEATLHHLSRITTEAGVELVVLNVDFLGTASVQAIRRAAQRDGIVLLDEVRQLTEQRISEEFDRARDLRLTRAHLPGPPPVPLADATTNDPRGARILFRVQVPQPAGNVSMRGVWAAKEDIEFDTRMYDDGTHGDEVVGDSVYSVEVEAPPKVSLLRYEFYLDGVPEFEPYPAYPWLQAARDIRFGDDGVAFIERFGDRFLLADRAHPDALGHKFIAADLLEGLEHLGSFTNLVATPERAG